MKNYLWGFGFGFGNVIINASDFIIEYGTNILALALLALQVYSLFISVKKQKKEGPKRPISAYFFYLESRRLAIKEENPALSHTEIVRHTAIEWQNLGEADKNPFVQVEFIYRLEIRVL